jgi:predicted dehydrogenase
MTAGDVGNLGGLQPSTEGGLVLRCAIVGLGYWGRNYVRVVGQSREAELVAVYDPSEDAIDAARSASFGPPWRVVRDAFEIFASDDIDAIIVATPASTHFDLVHEALDAGKHVLCEKPLAMSADACRALAEDALRAGRTLFVGHTFIYNPAVQTAKRLVAAGELGDVLHLHAVWAASGPIRHDVNALWDLAPHPISIMTHLAGCPTAVSATGQRILPGELEDVAALHLRFGDRATGDIHVSWLGPRKTRTLTITGARRVAIFDDMAGPDKLRVYETAAEELLLAEPGRISRVFEAPAHVPSIPAVEPLAAQLAHFVQCCIRGVTPDEDVLAADAVVGVLEAAHASLAEGGAPIVLAGASA